MKTSTANIIIEPKIEKSTEAILADQTAEKLV